MLQTIDWTSKGQEWEGYYYCGQPQTNGGGGVWKSPFSADILCEWPLFGDDLEKSSSNESDNEDDNDEMESDNDNNESNE